MGPVGDFLDCFFCREYRNYPENFMEICWLVNSLWVAMVLMVGKKTWGAQVG